MGIKGATCGEQKMYKGESGGRGRAGEVRGGGVE